MARILQAPWLAPLLGAILYLVTTVVLMSRVTFALPTTEEKADLSAENDPSWHFHNPEFNQWLAQIKTEKESLDQREQQLNELQIRLNAERQEIMAVTQTVFQLQSDFDKSVVRFTTDQVTDAKRQSKVIANMSPDGAAKMMAEMPDDQTLPVLFALKTDQSGAILDAMSQMGRPEAERAARLTMQMRKVLSAPTNSASSTGKP
jgi:flagellar motility protein MotE (MotC chaperone)